MSEELLFDELHADCGISNASVLEIKDKRSASKNLASQLEARLLLLKFLATKDKELLDPICYDGTKLKELKELSENLAEKINNLIPELSQRFINLHEKMIILADKVTAVKAKSQQYSKLKREKVDKIQEIFEQHLPASDFYLHEDLLSKIETAKMMCQNGKENLSKLQIKLEDMKGSCEQLTETLSQKENLYQTQNQKLEKQLNLSQQLHQMYESFTGVSLQKYDKNSVQIELKAPQDGGTSLLVTFFFKQSQNGTMLVSEVQVNNSDVYITDCIEHVQKIQNLPSCVKNIIDRWHYYSSLKEQINDIQNRLPADWIQHLNRLRVIVGKNANIICTLQLSSADHPNIALLSVRSGDVKMKGNIAPTKTDASVKEWVAYLEEYFGQNRPVGVF
ncbi:uncharacterized protein LOC106868412 isoform X2 [Octopus bimaculoides]|nr:uncharacterized protein LOC106868412 isoform X2 [Octopus bimaculoides]XP_014769138.1 uncharacterized protein LOC106868412 isoform X2 [Octopus bimaculoides]XP_052834340.1 uncharacterized protein LOC106868412 isoform X2 [Octopus bimaculoides]XP_052834341.1 uncharacterized protein LOC106868412 isoform X2 [Octopus bimaculoides]|eukprot:XP_014769137.1 PREDICTED: uncharacterized protein LOC106868412 isoform X2 [Octopus bimaculoides]